MIIHWNYTSIKCTLLSWKIKSGKYLDVTPTLAAEKFSCLESSTKTHHPSLYVTNCYWAVGMHQTSFEVFGWIVNICPVIWLEPNSCHWINYNENKLNCTSYISCIASWRPSRPHFSLLFYLTLSVAHFFWLWQKWVYQSVQCHTGLTHPFNFLTFRQSGAQSWEPECTNVKKLKMVC